MIKFRLTAGLVAIGLVVSMCGCSIGPAQPEKYPLVPALTESEVIDYYAKAMSFDAIIKKNIDVSKTNYDTREVTDTAKLSQLKAALSKTEEVLKQMEYKFTEENDAAIDEQTFHYIKSYLNDRKLTNGTIQSVTQALGYYFMDVQYDIKAREYGTFTNQASLIGLNGAFVRSEYYDTDSIDTVFMGQAVKKLNEYYKENRIQNRKASFDKATGEFITIIDDGDTVSFTDTTITEPEVEVEGEVENEGDVEPEVESKPENDAAMVQMMDEQGNPVLDSEGNPVYESVGDVDGDVVETPTTHDDFVMEASVLKERKAKVDVEEFNSVVGSSTKTSAYMPKLNKVYNIPDSDGTVSGIGIYPSGIGGLQKFGFKRNQLAGTVTLRFVYKDDLLKSGTVTNENIYPVFSEVTTGISSNNDNVVPEFLMVEFQKLLERADRAIANCDLPGLMSGDIYSDMGVAILRGYEHQHVNTLRQISTIRRVIGRDISNSAYLLEVESQRQEGPKGADVYGVYRDKAYVVIEQQGQKFVITDWITMTRQMQTEPDINPDSAVAKRLVALNLAGEVTEDAKEEVKQLMKDLYQASTLRVLRGPKEIDTPEGKKTIEKGMYDCFDTDPAMLSSSKLEEINSRLRSLLVKHGTNVSAAHSGIVTEWIGGADNQVEFTTEEVITYNGRDNGVYMNCYYLVSKMQDTWVIDDLQIVTIDELSGGELQNYVSRIRG